ncbi:MULTISPECIES: DeoR/GlpR family DNA-binding transcription regulator [Shouchella]|uniref:HTH-type, DeoR family transcriptional regulator n=2 Tax=Shouchella TaxID=2893057 RepID=A0A060LVE8_9BACI|nr:MULTISPECIES: DeoR/GlpR family DNA-binding transcription regulator [Shouchella]AIC93760.1 HTH-type, DeoR family transcriptional regulator [Shouchella lehensis G1]WDF02675.1 DeoR/GlpR family DNA-binding transcription regulator [Shouchella hunanensis]
MLTVERQEMILKLVQEREVVKIYELIEATRSSESTIRRDLTELEQGKKLKRIHGGATVLQTMRDEPTMAQKSFKNSHEKKQIAKRAAEWVEDGDCIFLDAGSTTYEMIPYLKGKNIEVVTNGVMNIQALLEADIHTHGLGGHVKKGTYAFVGRGAIEAISSFRFNKAFIGTNGLTLKDGFTTPDPEEAYIKAKAIAYAQQAFVLADHTKFGDITFSTFASIQDVHIVTSSYVEEERKKLYQELQKSTAVEVVKL